MHFFFLSVYIFSLDGVVHFLSGLYAGAVLCIQTRFKWCFALFIFPCSVHNTSSSRGSTLITFITTSLPLYISLWSYIFCFLIALLIIFSPWFDRTGWLGVKHQVTYLLIMLLCLNFAFIIRFLLLFLLSFFFFSSLIVSLPILRSLCKLPKIYCILFYIFDPTPSFCPNYPFHFHYSRCLFLYVLSLLMLYSFASFYHNNIISLWMSWLVVVL